MSRVVAVLLSCLVLLSGSFTGTSLSFAQGSPPDLGDVILENALTGPGITGIYSCASGRQKREFANDGLTLTISGGCQTEGEFPGSGVNVQNRLTMPDGEVRVDFRQLSGLDRTQVQIFLRTKNEPMFSGYGATLTPTRGRLDFGVSVNGQYKNLGSKNDLATIVKPDDWNTFAVRAQSQSFWVFLNDQMVFSTTDGSLDDGIANVVVRREGQPNAADTQEVSAVLRNLKVSAIAGGDQARRPVYTPPPPVVTASTLPCTQPTAVTNDVKMTPPGADVDPAIAKLAGPWEGVWEQDTPNALPSRLYVEQFAPDKVTVVYTWGETANGSVRAGWQRLAADIAPDGKITWGTTRKFTFSAIDDNSIQGTLETAQFTSKITMTRCPPR